MTNGQSQKPLIYIIGGNNSYREELSQSLDGMYAVEAFSNFTEGHFACSVAMPVAMIIDEVVQPKGGANFIAMVRDDKTTRLLPVVFTASEKNTEAIAEARSSGGAPPGTRE